MGDNRIKLFTFQGQRFGRAVVVEPEVRVGRRDSKPHGYRCARLECCMVWPGAEGACGTRYLAQISHLYRGEQQQCPDCSRRLTYGNRRHKAGLVAKNGNGFSVVVYVGRFKTRAEAEEVARRSRALVLPKRDAAGAVRNGTAALTGIG